MLATVPALFVAFYGFLFTLQRTGNLPPPAFSNSICVDEKLSFLRQNHSTDPNFLIIGSSVAWRHIDSSVIAEQLPGAVPLNAAFCGLHVNQTAYVANWLLDRHPTAKTVVMLASPQDFEGCKVNPPAVFNRDDADSYVYGGASAWPYYMQYFSPASLLRNALEIAGKRDGTNQTDPLVFTAYGDGPVVEAENRGLYYDMADQQEQECFNALATLIGRLHKEQRNFTLVTTPLHPDWKQEGAPSASQVARFKQNLQSFASKAGIDFWDADAALNLDAEQFFDAIHIRWSGAHTLTKVMARRLQQEARKKAGLAAGL
jgi:hypothetical protein